MKKYFLIAGAVALTVLSCKQSETKTETTENPDGSVTITTVETDKSTALDSATINATVDKAKEKLNVAGETLQKAGEDVKDAASKGAEKVEKGAEKVKEDLKK